MKWRLTLTVSVILLAGCATEEADTPAFSEGEAIAVVQTKLMEIGCDSWWERPGEREANGKFPNDRLMDWKWSEDYLGDGKWRVIVEHGVIGNTNEDILVFELEVYEHSLSINWLPITPNEEQDWISTLDLITEMVDEYFCGLEYVNTDWLDKHD